MNAGSSSVHERGREGHAWTKYQHKVDGAGGTKEKKEANKYLEATKKHNYKRVQKEKAKPKSQGTGI